MIKLLQNEPKETGQYFYLIQLEESGPYDLLPLLELEDHQKLQDYTKYYTLSSKGITTYLNDEPVEFITLNDWLADRENYNKIRKKTLLPEVRQMEDSQNLEEPDKCYQERNCD